MNKDQLLKLIKRAQKEPDFFHKLVFDPEKAVREIQKIDSSTKKALLKIEPNALVKSIVSGRRTATDCGLSCGETHISSELECSLQGVTCAITCSCSTTCSQTNICGATRLSSEQECGMQGATCSTTCSTTCFITCSQTKNVER